MADNEMIPTRKSNGRTLIGQVMKVILSHSANIVDVVEVLGVEHGMIRLRYLERSRKPVIWTPISSILELRETDDQSS